MWNIFEKLERIKEECADIESEENFDLALHTTIGCGGNALMAFAPETYKQAGRLIFRLKREQIPFFILGGGSNVLPCEEVFQGAVILTKKFTHIISFDESRIFCDCGAKLSSLASFAKERSLSGVEFLSGIPGTVGGATFMNAGSGGIYMDSVVESVVIYDGKTRMLSKDECEFSYKHSVFQESGAMILGAYFSLLPCSRQKIESNIWRYLKRRAFLPKGRSMGCVFKNPDGTFAGKIIQECSLSGRRVGGAYVSEQHANFIISDGKSASDVKELIAIIKSEVFEKTGIKLEEEIRYIGDNENDFNGGLPHSHTL